MDVVLLSRLQFATATMFHFLFVPFTLGLSFLVAYMETRYVKTGDETYLRMTKFWGKLFLINFAIGVVTGITLEFQFGTNWSRYSAYVGDIFGSLLAIEATTSFFLESTLIGVWIFGWKKLSKKAHAAVMWLIAVASTFSAVWILIANAWLQNPVGYAIRDGRAELVDFVAVLFQKSIAAGPVAHPVRPAQHRGVDLLRELDRLSQGPGSDLVLRRDDVEAVAGVQPVEPAHPVELDADRAHSGRDAADEARARALRHEVVLREHVAGTLLVGGDAAEDVLELTDHGVRDRALGKVHDADGLLLEIQDIHTIVGRLLYCGVSLRFCPLVFLSGC